MQRIVVGVDGSESSRNALAWAADWCREVGAQLTVGTAARHVTDLLPVDATSWIVPDDLEQEARDLQQGVVDQVDLTGVDVTKVVVFGHPTDVLRELAEAADLLVIGSRGLGTLTGALLGSISHQMVTHATCPTVVVSGPSKTPSKIIVAIDGSDHARRAADWAAQAARTAEASVEVVMVHQFRAAPLGSPYVAHPAGSPLSEQLLNASYQQLDDVVAHMNLPELAVERTVTEGPTVQRLLERSAHGDLLVIGSRGLGGFKGMLMGSVTHRVLHHSECPVAVIP